MKESLLIQDFDAYVALNRPSKKFSYDGNNITFKTGGEDKKTKLSISGNNLNIASDYGAQLNGVNTQLGNYEKYKDAY